MNDQPELALEPNGVAPSRLTPNELRRRVWHIAPGLLPFLLWPIPHRDPISPTLRYIMLAIIVVLAVFIYARYRLIARTPSESNRLPAVAGYAGSVLATLLLFPGHAELGLTVLAVLAFGDGSATLGGLMLGGPKLPWNRRKTWTGLMGFVAIGTPMAALIYRGETHNVEALPPGGVTFYTALLLGGSAVVASAIVESVPSRINDNIRVGVTAALALIIAQTVCVGWI